MTLGFFLRMLYLFKVGKLGAFLTHGRQYSRMDLVFCDVIAVFHSRAKQAQTERALFFTECLFADCFVFLHRIPSFIYHRLELVRRSKNGSILQSLTVYACFVGECGDTEMTLQKKCPEKARNFLALKGYNISGENAGPKTFSP